MSGYCLVERSQIKSQVVTTSEFLTNDQNRLVLVLVLVSISMLRNSNGMKGELPASDQKNLVIFYVHS